MQDIKDTYNMLLNARLSKTYLLITSSAINMSILAGVFINMMVDTMDPVPEDDDAAKEA